MIEGVGSSFYRDPVSPVEDRFSLDLPGGVIPLASPPALPSGVRPYGALRAVRPKPWHPDAVHVRHRRETKKTVSAPTEVSHDGKVIVKTDVRATTD